MRHLIFLTRRLSYTACVLVGISVLVFLLARVIPGDPARMALGPSATQDQVELLRHRLGLDKPIHIQYYNFVRDILRGQMGISLITMRDVSEDIFERFPATLELVFVAMALGVLAGIPIGITSALHKDRLFDHTNRVVAFSGVSLPQFWIAIMLQLLLGYYLGILPMTGRITGPPPRQITGLFLLDSLLTGNLRAFHDSLIHIVLPAFTLSLAALAQISRLLRASMIEQLRKDYTIVSRLMGMPETLNTYKYMLKNGITSSLTTVGLAFGYLLGNAFIIETVFDWPGMTSYGVTAVLNKDFNAIIGVTIIAGLGYLLVTFVMDLIYMYLDPRLRLERQ